MTKKIILGLAILAGTVSYAQNQQPAQPAVEPSYGLLGQRYAQVGFGFIDVNKSTTDAYNTGVNFNVPINANVDVNLAYTYGWVEGNRDVDGHSVDVGATYYVTQGQLKPLGRVTLGYVWPDFGDELTWGAAAGFEYIVSQQVSFQVTGGYDDNFKKHNEGQWDLTTSANFWVTPTIAVQPQISWIEGGNVGYAVAASFKF